LDSRWIPYESMWSPYGFCIELWVEVFFRWTPSGLHMDLWSPGGLHLESVGEGKLHPAGFKYIASNTVCYLQCTL
jgi:hypothetical protein